MQTDMTKGNPFSIIIRFMLPLMLGNIFQQLYNMADTIIVGRMSGRPLWQLSAPPAPSCS